MLSLQRMRRAMLFSKLQVLSILTDGFFPEILQEKSSTFFFKSLSLIDGTFCTELSSKNSQFNAKKEHPAALLTHALPTKKGGIAFLACYSVSSSFFLQNNLLI